VSVAPPIGTGPSSVIKGKSDGGNVAVDVEALRVEFGALRTAELAQK